MATPDRTSQGISQAVVKAIKAAGLSQRDAADQSGIPFTTLRRRLTGHSPFLVSELAVLAELIGCSVSDFIRAAEDAA
jgi:transcriptional regulator with XRE-family HTH domain